MVNHLATLMLVRARCPYIEYTMQHAATVAFMGITGVNIYAATIIVYIIAGIANADKRGSDLQYDESRVGKPRVLVLDETTQQDRSKADNTRERNEASFYRLDRVYLNVVNVN